MGTRNPPGVQKRIPEKSGGESLLEAGKLAVNIRLDSIDGL